MYKNFNEALESPDIKKIMLASAKRFNLSIDSANLEQCQLIALWKAIQLYSKKRRCKFTTYLFNYVDWECKNWIRQNKRKNSKIISAKLSDIAQKDQTSIFLDLPANIQFLLQQRYLYRFSLREMAKLHNVSHETIRKRINKALKVVYNIMETGNKKNII